MRAFLLRFIQDAKHRDMVTVPAENEREFLPVLYGLVQRVRRFAQAYVRLEKAGFATEASVLLRAALEAHTELWLSVAAPFDEWGDGHLCRPFPVAVPLEDGGRS